MDPNTTHTDTEGVWITPQGSRVEIRREGALWRAYPYPTLHGGVPGPVYEYDTAEQVRALVADLEAGGHRRDPQRAPAAPPTTAAELARAGAAAQWSSPAHVIGALLLLVLLVAIGVAVLA